MDEWMDPLDTNRQSAVTLLNVTSYDDFECDDFIYITNLIPTFYFLMFPIALLLNGVAAWVSLRLSSTNTFVVFLKNLVAADMIMTLLVPINAASKQLTASNALFALSCRYFSTLFFTTQYTCIAFLGLIGLERFFKIMTPQSKLLGQNRTFGQVISGSVWVTLFVCMALPNMILTNKSVDNATDKRTCMTLKGPAGLEFHHRMVIFLNVFFWLVCVVITVCYICIAHKVIQSFKNSGSNNTQGKQKIKLRVFLIVVVFFVSFVPYHLARILYTFLQVTYSSHAYCAYLKARVAKEISLLLANTNICMDPLLYVFLCREFKEKLVCMLKKVSVSFEMSSAGKAEVTPRHRVNSE